MRLRNVAIFLRLHIGWDREVAMGIARYARTRPAWRVFIWPSSTYAIELPPRWRCHGAIAYPNDPAIAAVRDAPIVFVGGSFPDRFSVCPDNRPIGRMAAEHLHEMGHRRMTFHGGPSQWSLEREASFRQAVEAMGDSFIPCPLRHSYRVDLEWTDAASALARWLGEIGPPLGLLGANDQSARLADQSCQIAGLRVPEQVAILGVDNDLMRCEMSGTPLSSIDPAADQIGYRAAEALDRWMRTGQAPVESILVPPRDLVQRRSTDVLAIGDEDVVAALRFVRDHAFENLGVDDVAEAACVPSRALAKRFKRHVGRSVRQEITRLRVEKACQLLRTTENPIDFVARASGFTNLSHFHNVFRRHLGRTPFGYRRWARDGNAAGMSSGGRVPDTSRTGRS